MLQCQGGLHAMISNVDIDIATSTLTALIVS